MANKYRIGTTVGITVNIDNMPSETANMYVRSEYGTFDMSNVAVKKGSDGSPAGISGKFEAANQKYVGKYDVIVICSSKRLCIDNAFELVKHSDEADADEKTEIVKDSVAFIDYPTVVSGYEEWRQTHNGTIEGYWDFVRDEPRIIQIEKDVKANKEAIDAEVERATAKDEDLQTQIETEKAEREDADKKITDDLWRNTPTGLGLDEETGEVYATFRDDSTISRTYISDNGELIAEIDEVGVNDDGELWSDIVVN